MRKLTGNTQLFKVVEAKPTTKSYRKTYQTQQLNRMQLMKLTIGKQQAMNTRVCIPHTRLSADSQ